MVSVSVRKRKRSIVITLFTIDPACRQAGFHHSSCY
jgi:hypothetical protein